VLTDGREDLRCDAINALPHLVRVALDLIHPRVNLQHRRPRQVIQQGPVRQAILQPDESRRRRQRNRVPDGRGTDAPPGQRLHEILLVAGLPGHEVPDEIELGRRRGMAQQRALPDGSGTDVVIILDQDAL
jgi:hypothetical protein